ncbi:MAG: hypothetical protein JWO03_2393 [Bacteroidetes bacterium]|nr:hypothetical protein [Bacteroidota bacterium]
MAELKQDWLTDGLIDFEYKKYLLLGYLQQVDKEFDAKKLYPCFSDLIDHYRNLEVLSEQKKILVNGFPKEITKIDLENLKFEYNSFIKDKDLALDIDEIISFAMPEIRSKMSLGKELFEEVEDKVNIFPVGILPLQTDEGYLLLSDYLKRIVNVYQYNITIFENAMTKFRGIHTRLIDQYDITVSNTYENIKYQLIKEVRDMPAPATYALEFKKSFPLTETMLPIAKRIFVKYVTA